MIENNLEIGDSVKLEEKYFLIVMGAFERGAIELDHYPTDTEIINAITKQQGKSAKVEKRHVLVITEDKQSEHTVR